MYLYNDTITFNDRVRLSSVEPYELTTTGTVCSLYAGISGDKKYLFLFVIHHLHSANYNVHMH